MTWYRLNKNALWKMATDSDKAVELVSHVTSGGVARLIPANMAPDTLVVDWESPDPEMAPAPIKPPGTSAPKPLVKWRKSPNFSARGTGIGRVILHYTTVERVEGTLSWFANPDSQVSAHYVVDRDGGIYQCVADDRKAWHAYGENDDSIGIEHVAAKGQTLTPEQSKASAALIRYLLAQYHLKATDVTAHRFTKSNIGRTACPGDLWKTEAELKAWVQSEVLGGTPTPPVKVAGEVATLRRIEGQSFEGEWAGLAVLNLGIGSQTFRVASGARGAQAFRKPADPRSVPGCLEPIPEGRYSIGDIEFAGGKDNYEASWGAGLGPVWVPINATFADDRSAFGFHLDSNSSVAGGSAGCVVFRDMADLKRFVAALRKHDPRILVVDWS